MTDQTIEGVSPALRALLERVVGKKSQTPYWSALDEDRIAAAAELRALLDDDERCHEFVPFQANCTKCGVPYKASAQPQGAPVEIGYIEHSKEINWEKAPVISRLIWTMPADQRHRIPQHYKVMLYAEQPGLADNIINVGK